MGLEKELGLSCEQINDFVELKIEETRTYLEAELAVLDVANYWTEYDYVDALPNRIRLFAEAQIRGEESSTKIKKLYHMKLSEELYTLARNYSPEMGSVPESIGTMLRELAKEFSE